MKLQKYLLIVALFGAGLLISCTPENVEDEQTEQQVDRDSIQTPQNG